MNVISMSNARTRAQEKHAEYLAGVAAIVAAEVEERGWDGEIDDLKDLTHREVAEMIGNGYAAGSGMYDLMHIGLARGLITTQGKYRQWTEECSYLLSIGKSA